MHLRINHQPPSIADMAQRLAAQLAREGIRPDGVVTVPPDPAYLARRSRSLRTCHLPAEPEPRYAPPRGTNAYMPELAARIDDDRNLTDGARRCGRKLAEYIYRRDREGRKSEITVTYLMKALQRSRRTVQRYLRQLEREGYIAVEVIHAATRMCAGLFIELLSPLLPKHGWAQKLRNPDVPRKSQNHRLRIKYSRESWALRCMDGVFRSLMKTLPPLLPIS
jgi:hypothetical protein